MFEERISVNGENYILGPYLASGLIGTVFPARREDDPDEKIVKAVKVPAPNLTKDLLDKFWLEFETLFALNQTWGGQYHDEPSPFPAVDKGKKDDKEKTEALVMDYVPDSEILSRVFKDIENPFERETKYLEAAFQYFQMLFVLHTAGYACPDRKTPDVRWHENRLAVLDWNVVTKNPSTDDIKQDYYLFGSMWTQFLTGKYAAVTLNVLDDEYWGDLSVGTRILLEKLLQGQYADDGGVASDIQRLIECRKQDHAALAQTARDSLGKIEGLEKKIQDVIKDKNKGGGSENLDGNEKFDNEDLIALTKIDLAWHLGGGLYLEERRKFVQFVQDRPKRFTYYAQIALLRGNYQEGLDTANRLHVEMQSQDAGLRLLLERWRVLLQAAVSQSGTFREAGKVYSEWLSNFTEPSTQEDALKFWDTRVNDFPRDHLKIDQNLKVFLKELELRRAWSGFYKFMNDGRYDEAQQAFNLTKNFLSEIKTLEEEYARLLEQSVLQDFEQQERKINEELRVIKFLTTAKIDSVAKELLQENIHLLIQNSWKKEDWLKRINSALCSMTELISILSNAEDNNDYSKIIGVVSQLLKQADLWRALGVDINRKTFGLLQNLPFSAEKEGIRERLNVANSLSEPDAVPVHLQAEIEKIMLAYICDAFCAVEKMVNEGSLNREHFDEFISLYESYRFKFQKG